jgi:murein DD-endopeptidase MepM/ murein hydrolase activator NlpD
MARKFYTCIIVPDASQQLHKLRIPVKGLYVLAAIGILSFFAAVGLGFNYIGMASRMAGYHDLEAENARLKVDTRQLKLSTTKLNRQVIALESEAEKITKALVEADPVFKRLVRATGSVGGSKTDVSTSELEGSLQTNVELIRQRMADVERNLGFLDARSKNLRSSPRVWPVLNGRIGSHYGGRLDPFTGESETHLGIDIVAPKGTSIKATADGVVIYAAWQGDYGNLIVLKHPNGFTTRYAHLSKFKVKEGDIVERNDTIGLVGTTGRTTAAHLHYEVRLNDRAVNPRPYLIN